METRCSGDVFLSATRAMARNVSSAQTITIAADQDMANTHPPGGHPRRSSHGGGVHGTSSVVLPQASRSPAFVRSTEKEPFNRFRMDMDRRAGTYALDLRSGGSYQPNEL